MNYTDYTNTEAFTSMNFQESILQLINNKIASCDMAWTTLVNYLQGECGFSEMVIFLGTVFFIHGVAFQGLNIIYTLIINTGLVEKYKIQEDKVVTLEERLKIIPLLIKHRMIQILFSVPVYYLWKFAGGDILAPMPSASTVVRHFLFALVFLEVWFYFGHRAMHEVSWLKGWHKTHHEFKAPVSLAAEYADWKEDIFVNMTSTVVGIILCGCHPIELFFFVVFRIWETVDVHCGYALPFTPFRSEMHDYHHMRNNGCYGAFFMDDLLGTNKRFMKHLEKKRANKD